MRVSFSVEGGMASFAGLREPQTFDSDALPADEQMQLCSLVDQARFFTCAVSTDHTSTPDTRTYALEIEDGGRHRKLRLHEPIADAAMSTLLQAVRGHVHALRARSRNGKD